MKNYLVQAFEMRKDTVIPQFNRIMGYIKILKEQKDLSKDAIYFSKSLPRYPENSEWKPSERLIYPSEELLPEVMELLTEKGYDIIIYKDKSPTEISWEHYEDGRKGTIIYKDEREIPLEEKIKCILGSSKKYTENQNWEMFKMAIYWIVESSKSGELHYDMNIAISTEVANALAILGYNVDLYKKSPFATSYWSTAKKGRKGMVKRKVE